MGIVEKYYQDLNERRGQAAELIVYGESTRDAFGGTIKGEPTFHPVTVIVTQYTTELIAASYGLISPDDVRVFIYNSPEIIKPETTHKLRLDGVDYDIAAVRQRSKAAPVIAYELQVRNA